MPPHHFVVRGKLEGGEALVADLKALGISVRGTTRKAARAGAQVIQKDAEARAATISKRGGKNTRIKTSARAGHNVEASVLPSARKWYLRYAETGTQGGVRTAKSGSFSFYASGRRIVVKRIRHPGTAARPWLRPAFDARQNEARDEFGKTIGKAIDEKRAQIDRGDE